MSKSKPFVVPEGVVFTIEDDGVTIENAGDIVLHTDFGGRMLKRIVSREGDVELHGEVQAGEVRAAGAVKTGGSAQIGLLRAGGDVAIAGHATLADSEVAGALNVQGNASLGRAELSSHLRVAGALTTGDLQVVGNASVEGTLTAKNVNVGGDLQVAQATTVDSVRAGGAVSIGGALTAGNIAARAITLTGATVQARGLQGSELVAIGIAKLTVDAILAPQVKLDPKTSGRVTVIESQNELGPNAIKGGFRLADYGEMFGNPEGFLAERGLVPLGAAAAPPPVSTANPAAAADVVHAGEPDAPETQAEAAEAVEAEVVEAAEAVEAEVVEAAEAVEAEVVEAAEAVEAGEAEVVEAAEVLDAAEANVARVVIQPSPIQAAAAEEASDPEGDAGDHASGEPARVAIPPELPVIEPVRLVTDPWADAAAAAAAEEAAAGVVVPPPPPTLAHATSMHDEDPLVQAAEHPMHGQLADTIQKIIDCYAGQVLPPAVEKLRDLVAARQYPQIRAEITNIWSELLKFHRVKDMRIQHQVTTTFNSVNGLVKKM